VIDRESNSGGADHEEDAGNEDRGDDVNGIPVEIDAESRREDD
jgi:hypothetical protein